MSHFDVTIAGEINLDLILYGLDEEMPLERELLADEFRLTLGSSSAILAHNMAALGMKVGFITQVGADPLGEIAYKRLVERGVDVSKVITVPDRQTGVTILLHHGATRHILTYAGVMADMKASDLDFRYLASGRHFHVSSIYLQKGLQAGLPDLCRKLKNEGLTISLDTNDDPDDLWAGPLDELLNIVDIFLPNEDEAMRIARTEDGASAARHLAKRVPIVAMKCGRRGSIVRAGENQWTVPSLAVEPIDTIGAGDSFNAGFLKGFLDQLPLPECAAFGNATAALSTLRPGGTESFRDGEFVREFLAGRTV
jgi:sugar/nucleoside kinase (ribokinase family)